MAVNALEELPYYFQAELFLAAHPEYGWMRGLLRDMKTQPWTRFSSEMKLPRVRSP